MNPNSRSLAMRDPTLAALMGVLPGSDFGVDSEQWRGSFNESDFGDDYGDDSCGFDYDATFGNIGATSGRYGVEDIPAGWEDSHAWEDMHGDMGWEDAPHGDMGAEFGAAAPSQAALMAAWHSRRRSAALAQRRHRLLYPNKGSDIKIEGYEFSLSFALTIGTAVTVTMADRPTVEIRTRRVNMNSPAPGFITFTQLQIANINTLVGGVSDTFFYSSLAQDQGVSYPTLNPATPASFTGSYTGLIPPGFPIGLAYTFCVEFKGPASMTA